MNKVTVVTVTYNCFTTIEKTINSVLQQLFCNIEYIIIDGNSNDGTQKIIEKYRRNISFYISEKDSGIYDAMNKGIMQATGDWIIFMNAGDTFSCNSILNEIFTQNDYSEIGVIYGDVYLECYSKKFLKRALNIEKMKECLPFCHQSSFVRIDLIKKYMFDLSYKIAADYNFFRRLYDDNINFCYLNMPIAIYELTSGVSAANLVRNKEELSQISGRNKKSYNNLKIWYSVLCTKISISFIYRIKAYLFRL